MSNKQRLDTLLLNRGLDDSRERAKALIMQGIVYVDGQKADKPGTMFMEDCSIEIRGKKLKYASRGGLKLEKAMEVFPILLKDKVAMDVGASTGGFTDCMLMNGASKVYCVDVGYGQLAWKLRSDNRVINMERTNIRYVTEASICEKPQFISVDVSFISLSLVLPVVFSLLDDNGECVCLIKPQFEAGRDKVGKKGIIRDLDVHVEVMDKVISIAKKIGFSICGLDFSPVKGPEGNIEFLLFLSKNKLLKEAEVTPLEVALDAHRQLNV